MSPLTGPAEITTPPSKPTFEVEPSNIPIWALAPVKVTLEMVIPGPTNSKA
jgi:hypothetical protein